MSAHIDYYLVLNSPWSYMGGSRLRDIVAKTGASLAVRPVMLAVLFEKTGGLVLPKRSPERQAYRLAELARWRDRLGVSINTQPAHFPSDESRAARAVIAAQNAGQDALGLSLRLGKALWENEESLADEDTLMTAIADTGLDVDALLSEADSPATQTAWEENTKAAIAAGVFGVPSYVVKGEVLWGQDRLDFLPDLLRA